MRPESIKNPFLPHPYDLFLTLISQFFPLLFRELVDLRKHLLYFCVALIIHLLLVEGLWCACSDFVDFSCDGLLVVGRHACFLGHVMVHEALHLKTNFIH